MLNFKLQGLFLFLVLTVSCLTRKKDAFIMNEKASKRNLRKELCLKKNYIWYEEKRICFCDKNENKFFDTKLKKCLEYK